MADEVKLFRVSGKYRWTEERTYACWATIDVEVEAADEEDAIDVALEDVSADGELKIVWSSILNDNRKSITVKEIQPPNEDEISLEYMRQYSTPLFDMEEVDG